MTSASSITVEEELMYKYGSYIPASLLFIALLIIFLLYWTFHYKKSVKNLKAELAVRNEGLKTIQRRIQNNEVLSIKKEHELEKKILEFTQTISNLEKKLKEGLKSQVVSKIEEYQMKRIKSKR
jgi:hypothetical protein